MDPMAEIDAQMHTAQDVRQMLPFFDGLRGIVAHSLESPASHASARRITASLDEEERQWVLLMRNLLDQPFEVRVAGLCKLDLWLARMRAQLDAPEQGSL